MLFVYYFTGKSIKNAVDGTISHLDIKYFGKELMKSTSDVNSTLFLLYLAGLINLILCFVNYIFIFTIQRMTYILRITLLGERDLNLNPIVCELMYDACVSCSSLSIRISLPVVSDNSGLGRLAFMMFLYFLTCLSTSVFF